MERKAYVQIRRSLSFEKKWSQLIGYLVFDICLYSLTVGLLFLDNPWSLLAAPLIAILMFRNFAFMHDAVHGGLIANKYLRYCVGLVSGTVCFLPYDLWKKSHLQHHYWAGNYEQDPVLLIVKRFPKASVASKKVFAFFWRSGIPFAGLSQNIVFWINAYKNWRMNIFSLKSWFDFLVPVVAWGFLLASLSLWQTVVLCLGVGCYLRLAELINFPHHVGLYLEQLGDNHLSAVEQYEITRTCLYSRWFEHLILLNFNYHSEHHMYPDLPWHQLAIAHQKLMKSEVGSSLNIVSHRWIYEQQKKDFSEFVFPPKQARSRRKAS